MKIEFDRYPIFPSPDNKNKCSTACNLSTKMDCNCARTKKALAKACGRRDTIFQRAIEKTLALFVTHAENYGRYQKLIEETFLRDLQDIDAHIKIEMIWFEDHPTDPSLQLIKAQINRDLSTANQNTREHITSVH